MSGVDKKKPKKKKSSKAIEDEVGLTLDWSRVLPSPPGQNVG